MLNPIKMGFREFNHFNIDRLTEAELSDETIASAINDEMKQKKINVTFTANDIRSYKKLTDISSKCSLISKKKMDALTANSVGLPEPAI
ncbi:MAG: hypothetical protein WCI11_12740 [Candidatus Methylumidiphilus sp.]